MEGIDHVDVVQIRSGGLVSQIHRMLQRDIPDGESLKFCISGPDAPFVFMIKLGQAGSHLPAARPRSRHHHQGA